MRSNYFFHIEATTFHKKSGKGILQFLLPGFLFLLLPAFWSCYSSSTASPAAQKTETPPKPSNPALEAFLQDYDRYFAEAFARAGSPGASVVVVFDTAVVFVKGYGVARAGAADPVDAHTVFRVGSLSKGFAGTLTQIMVEDSVFFWDDPLVKYYPSFALKSPEQTRRTTLKHIISHTTGLPYHAFTNLVESGESLDDIAKRFSKLPLNGKEGQVFSYQNAAFSLIGEAMRNATGRSYPELLQNYLFGPAGMDCASATYEAMMATSNKAWPHVWTGYGWAPVDITDKYYNTCPAGGINACAADMGQYLRVLLGNRPDILPPAALDTLFNPLVCTNNERRFFRNWPGQKTAYYARGWRVVQHNADTLVYHGGFVNDYRGEIAIDRKNRVAVCLLFNASADMIGDCIPTFFEKFWAVKDAVRPPEVGARTGGPLTEGYKTPR